MELMTNNKMTMTSLDISELLGSRHDNVKRTIETLASKGVIELPQTEEIKTATKPTSVFVFSDEKGKRDSIVVVAQLSPEFTALIVDRWQELEKKVSAPPVPQLPVNYIEALEALVVSEKEKAQIAYERDEAIKTKALIGSKREATAMATASAAVKEANKLKQQLDQSVEYATIKRMELIHHGIKFQWRLLKSTSIEMGIPAIDVFDQNYGTVKAYHADVWKEAYAVEVA